MYEKPITIDKSTIVTGRSFKDEYKPSFSNSVSYTFVDSAKNGLEYRVYEGAWTKLSDFRKLKATQTGRVYQLNVDKIDLKYDFAVVFSGFVNIPQDGRYTFYTKSNDGSKLLIGNTVVVDNDGEHGVEEKSGEIVLQKGKQPIQVPYFQSGGSKTLEVLYKGSGIEKQVIPAEKLFR